VHQHRLCFIQTVCACAVLAKGICIIVSCAASTSLYYKQPPGSCLFSGFDCRICYNMSGCPWGPVSMQP
jgi:hypothetical protein